MKSAYHESAELHTTGKAIYIDDIQNINGIIQGFAYTSPIAAGELIDFDLSEAKKTKGIYTILSYKDIPGKKYTGGIVHDEPILVQKEISYIGQALFLIAAENEKAATEAMNKIKVKIIEKEPVLTIEQAMKKNLKLEETRKIEKGNPDKAIEEAPFVIEGIFRNNGQEHWYLETHSAICIPGEYNEIKVYSSTQNPSEVQMQIAEALGINMNDVEVETRRLGGGFGGKESQAGIFAIWAALLAKAIGKPVKVRLKRNQDQLITGKRHAFLNKYKVGFDENGKILGAIIELNSNAGAFADLSMPILERAMLHAENAYFIPNIRILGTAWKTNLPPNTAFRGFGAPQGIANIDNIIRKIAATLKKDPIEIQKINFYNQQNNETPYGQIVKGNRLQTIFEKLTEKAQYHKRRQEIQNFNKKHKYIKRGIDLMPVKFGISFTSSFLNQAGALINIYTDGTVLVNHGGIEMGQGLYTKIRQIAANELGVPLEKIKVNATNTSKVPNTSPTAASTGSDMNGMAVKNAIDNIKNRLKNFFAEYFNKNYSGNKTLPENITFNDYKIYDKENPSKTIDFDKAMNIARLNRISLSSTGFYKTPGVYFDRQKGKGNPFYYFAYGMAITEVEVDLLTGNVKILRTDILHDTGNSINPEIDKGQIEGAFMQAVGWTLFEDLKYSEKGRLLTDSPDTYKIPTIFEMPEIFNVELLNQPNDVNTIAKSKAVGEPPFILGLSAFFAVKDALWSITNYNIEPELFIPATNEYIVVEADRLLKYS